MRWGLLFIALAAVSPAVTAADEAPARLAARPHQPTIVTQPGEHALDLGEQRDGLLYIPAGTASAPRPLLVLLHGAGQRKEFFRFMFPLADELGVILLVIDSRGRTWDAIMGVFGPDVRFIDEALRHTFERVAVDPQRLAIGGYSDGASYALSLGIANGDLYTHVVAFSPGSFRKPGFYAGRPPIFLSHGTRDDILDIDRTSRRVVPVLRAAGYEVDYREFDGGHEVPPALSREALAWLTKSGSAVDPPVQEVAPAP